jgi:hypothetical protein
MHRVVTGPGAGPYGRDSFSSYTNSPSFPITMGNNSS